MLLKIYKRFFSHYSTYSFKSFNTTYIVPLNIQISVKIPESEHNRFSKGPWIRNSPFVFLIIPLSTPTLQHIPVVPLNIQISVKIPIMIIIGSQKVHEFIGNSPFVFLIPLSTPTLQISVKIPENEHNRFPKGPWIRRQPSIHFIHYSKHKQCFNSNTTYTHRSSSKFQSKNDHSSSIYTDPNTNDISIYPSLLHVSEFQSKWT